MLASEILTKAADLIEQPGKWIKGNFALSDDCSSIHGHHSGATCFCSIGAIEHITQKHFSTIECRESLRLLFTTLVNLGKAGIITDFNDDDETTQQDVVSLFRSTAAYALTKGL